MLDKPKGLSEQRADRLWSMISGEEPMAAHRAVWEFISCGERGLEAVEKRWQIELGHRTTIAAQRDSEVEKVFSTAITALGAEDFLEREKASAAIARLGPAAIARVEAMLIDESLAFEVRTRLKRLKSQLDHQASSGNTIEARLDSRLAHIRRVLDKSVTLEREHLGEGA